MGAVFSNFCGTSVVPQQQTAQGRVRVDFSGSNPPVLSEEFDFIANETVAQFRKRVEQRVNRLGGTFVLHVTKRNKPKREFLDETEIIREKYVYCLVNSVHSPAPAARSVRVYFLGVIPPIPPEEFDFIHGETGVELLHRALKRVNHYGGTLIGDKAFMRDQIIQENQEYSIYGSSPLQAATFPVQGISMFNVFELLTYLLYGTYFSQLFGQNRRTVHRGCKINVLGSMNHFLISYQVMVTSRIGD